FYSAEDADSEGEEGKFYVWTPDEIEAVLGKEDGRVFGELYGVTPHGNFEEGKSILHLKADLPYSLQAFGKDLAWWEKARAQMREARAKRPRPHLDDKILTAWNALLISALALGWQVLGEEDYRKAAQKAADFLTQNLFDNGRLLASYRKGPSHVQAYIDDYAFLQAALLDLYESTFDLSYLKKALLLESEMTRLFWDGAEGGFFFTGSDQKDRDRLLTRSKEAYDGVIPSGNSVAALSYFRLARLTGKAEYRQKAEAILKCFSGSLAQGASNFARMLQAFQFDFDGPAEIFVAGPRAQSEPILRALWKKFLPSKVLVFAEESQMKDLAGLAPWVEGRGPLPGGKPAIYVCRDYACQLPVGEADRALELLGLV
ncbi:MAG TPA: thioredoxin domain-containing protein, partial [bacterium]|nr:thioredoxin domain-containing protein [bacterium]